VTNPSVTGYYFLKINTTQWGTAIDGSTNYDGDYISGFLEIGSNTNVTGTFVLLEAARHYVDGVSDAARSAFRFLHVSTDEVYGTLGATGLFAETTPYAPNSPYAASKAAADHLVRAYQHTYDLPTLIKGHLAQKDYEILGAIRWMANAPPMFGHSGGGVFLEKNHKLVGITHTINMNFTSFRGFTKPSTLNAFLREHGMMAKHVKIGDKMGWWIDSDDSFRFVVDRVERKEDDSSKRRKKILVRQDRESGGIGDESLRSRCEVEISLYEKGI